MKQTRNYTEEETNQLLEAYLAAKSYDEQQEVVHQYSEKFHKPESSIRSKLVKLKVYVPASRVSGVTGKKPKTKIQIVKEMQELTGLDLDGLDKSPKLTLDRLYTYLEKKCQN